VVRTADRIYALLDESLTPVTMKQQTDDPNREPEADLGVGPTASETQTDRYRPVTNWVYRGAMNPDIIGTKQGDAGERGEMPAGTEGFAKAEVTSGGVDTNELSSQTMEARKVPGLYFVGEVVDVTGHLGGHNFQWAWASGFSAGQAV